MTTEEKIALVNDLCNGMREHVVSLIQDGKIPVRWDGHELRELIAELANNNRSRQLIASRKRFREYRNTRLVENF